MQVSPNHEMVTVSVDRQSSCGILSRYEASATETGCQPTIVPAESRRRRRRHRRRCARRRQRRAPSRARRMLPRPMRVPPIRIPAEFSAAQSAAPVTFDFPMTGAQVFARACKEEGVAALFACPGNYPVIHAMASSGIPAYGGRHEGSMAHAADAFIRVTGEIAVASGTEGPGFTDMICAIACANAARTPLLIVASNMSIGAEDTEGGIQLGYQQPTTEGLKKYGKRLIIPRRVHEYAGYAFRQLRSGVPKPVHLDFPAEVASARFKDATELEFFHDKARYRTESRPHPSPKAIASAVDMIRKAQRPIIVSSNGVFYAKAWDALKRVRREGADPGGRIGRHEGTVLRRQPALRECRARRAGQRRPRDPGRPALHAHRRRVRVRSGCEIHPHRSGGGRHRPQPADRSRHRQLRAGGARSARRCGAATDARQRGSRRLPRRAGSSRIRTPSTTRSASATRTRCIPR